MTHYDVYCECNKISPRWVPSCWLWAFLFVHVIVKNHQCTWWKAREPPWKKEGKKGHQNE